MSAGYSRDLSGWRNAYLGSTVLRSTLRSRQFTLPICLWGDTFRGGLLGLRRGLRSRAQHGRARDSRVDVSLVARAGSVRLQVLLLGSTLRARALQVLLGRQQLVMEN